MSAICVNCLKTYVFYVKAYPIYSAMLQFSILGTFGEIVSKWLINKNFKYPFGLLKTIWKMIVWAILAIGIKYAFKGFTGYLDYLIEHDMLPNLGRIQYAFTKSVMINLQFGLFLVLFHRVLDNVIETRKNWSNLDKGIYSLLWFWIPAHTLTFYLPELYQIGLAALWSVFLGLMLGFFNRNQQPAFRPSKPKHHKK